MLDVSAHQYVGHQFVWQLGPGGSKITWELWRDKAGVCSVCALRGFMVGFDGQSVLKAAGVCVGDVGAS